MQEAGWEHHVVAVEPELNSVLRVERVLLSSPRESASRENHGSAPAVDPEAAVVDWTIAEGEETGANRSHHTVRSENANPHVVRHSESSVQGVRSVFSLAHFDSLEESSDGAGSLSHHIIDEVLEATRVGEEPGLESLRHLYS